MKYLEIKTVDDLVRIIQVCVWAFVIFVLMMVLGGIVMSMLYSVIFVSQPIKTMAPIDAAFTKMLNDIVLILASSVTTIVSMFAVSRGSQALAEKIAPTLGIAPTSTPPITPTPSGGLPVWINPPLDEEWRAPPPPTTPPDYVDPAKEEIAHERAAARSET
jgi:hypothetical protein